jgi:hypothetical protein
MLPEWDSKESVLRRAHDLASEHLSLCSGSAAAIRRAVESARDAVRTSA